MIHFAAVGLASIHQHKQIDEAALIETGFADLDFEPPPPIDDPLPPDAIAPASIPNPTDDLIPEPPNLPPVRTRVIKLARPIQRVRNGTPGSLTLSTAKVLALMAPRLEYPYEARRQKITGNGIVIITVDSASGWVTDVMIEASTGSPLLDNAAITGFRRWRFKPGTVSRVRTPVSFILTGVQY
jgi:periplasmic protein TonB